MNEFEKRVLANPEIVKMLDKAIAQIERGEVVVMTRRNLQKD